MTWIWITLSFLLRLYLFIEDFVIKLIFPRKKVGFMMSLLFSLFGSTRAPLGLWRHVLPAAFSCLTALGSIPFWLRSKPPRSKIKIADLSQKCCTLIGLEFVTWQNAALWSATGYTVAFYYYIELLQTEDLLSLSILTNILVFSLPRLQDVRYRVQQNISKRKPHKNKFIATSRRCMFPGSL